MQAEVVKHLNGNLCHRVVEMDKLLLKDNLWGGGRGGEGGGGGGGLLCILVLLPENLGAHLQLSV